MRDLDPAFAAHIAGDATTLARCWRVTRRDGVAFGFTDHDRDLVFDGTTFRAGTGVSASAVESELGFAPGGGEIAGALADSAIADDDLVKGLWDGAEVEAFLVNWANPAESCLTHRASIGEVRRADAAFVAELRGPAAALDEERGRLFQSGCAASLGDARCGVDLSAAIWSATTGVGAVESEAVFTAGGLGAFAAGWFTGGLAHWLSGGNAGLMSEIGDHRVAGGVARIALWRRTPAPIVAGDAFRIEAGCDKRFSTCKAKFSNIANFRGFPHLPGEALLTRIVREGEAEMDGGSLFA